MRFNCAGKRGRGSGRLSQSAPLLSIRTRPQITLFLNAFLFTCLPKREVNFQPPGASWGLICTFTSLLFIQDKLSSGRCAADHFGKPLFHLHKHDLRSWRGSFLLHIGQMEWFIVWSEIFFCCAAQTTTNPWRYDLLVVPMGQQKHVATPTTMRITL